MSPNTMPPKTLSRNLGTVLECAVCGDRLETEMPLPPAELVWCGRKVCFADLFMTAGPGKSQWTGWKTVGGFSLFYREDKPTRPAETMAEPQSKVAFTPARKMFPWAKVGEGFLLGCLLGTLLTSTAFTLTRVASPFFVGILTRL